MAAIDDVFNALLLLPAQTQVPTAQANPEQTSQKREIMLDFGAGGKVRITIERWLG